MVIRDVDRLESLAFNAYYKDLIYRLSLLPEHLAYDVSEEFAIARQPILRKMGLPTKSDELIKYLRDQLDRCLVGTVNDEVRKKCVSTFNPHDISCVVPSMFLGVVLNSSFTELIVYLSLKCVPLSQVLSMIATHCPLLGKLELRFPLDYTTSDRLSLADFSNLTNLTLCDLPNNKKSFIGLGKIHLKSLSTSGEEISLTNILHIFLGENASILEADCVDMYGIHEFEFYPHNLAPICSSLSEIFFGHDFGNDMVRTSSFADKTPRRSIYSFILRHVKNLERFYCKDFYILPQIIEKLYVDCDENEPERSAKKMKMSPMTPRISQANDLFQESPFTGSLALTFLEELDITKVRRMEAVMDLCPLLESINLTGGYHDVSSTILLAFVKHSWPKLHKLGIKNFNTKDQRVLLAGIGHQLKSISFDHCQDLDPCVLKNCTQLETLMMYSTKVLANTGQDKLAPDVFLPNLKKLICRGRCLGSMSASFLKKSSLVSIYLDCFNLLSNPDEWRTLNRLWPRLKYFTVNKCTGLDHTLVEQIFLTSKHLKILNLPCLFRPSGSLRDKFQSKGISTFDWDYWGCNGCSDKTRCEQACVNYSYYCKVFYGTYDYF